MIYNALLEQTKQNIIDWYPIESEAKILEIASKEDMIENINSNCIEIVQSIEQLEKTINEKFDYILIIGKLKELSNDFDKILEKLGQNGKILIVENNKLSVKDMCQTEISKNLLNKKEIEEILNKFQLNYRKFYYVLHDYKKTNVIFTDKHLPNEETITRNITFYSEENIINNNENKIFNNILQQDPNLFKTFANSYFIECSKTEFEDNNIEFVSYSNIRKEEYKIKTIIKGKEVYKTFANDMSKGHIERIKENIDIMNENNIKTLDHYDKDTIISKYQENEKTLDRILINKIQNKEIDDAKEIIKKFYEELKLKLVKIENESNVFDKYGIEYQNEDINNLTFVKYGLWDLIFQNAFYINDEFFFYDQEWFEENIPVEYIMYRAIKYCKTLQDLLTQETLYDMIGLTRENLEIFSLLDDILQEEIRSDSSWNIHTNAKFAVQEIKRLKEEKETMNGECLKLLNQKDARIKFLEENMESTCNLLREKEEIIRQMENSKSWKITKPLRDLRRGKKAK